MTRQVEFLIAWNDGTWTTEVIEVPTTVKDDEGVDFDQFSEAVVGDLRSWADENLAPKPRYEGAVLFAAYHIEGVS